MNIPPSRALLTRIFHASREVATPRSAVLRPGAVREDADAGSENGTPPRGCKVPGLRLLAAVAWLVALPPCASAEAAPLLAGDAVQLVSGGQVLMISLKCPRLIFDSGEAGGVSPVSVQGNLKKGRKLEVAYPPLDISQVGTFEARLMVEWSPEEGTLRKWAEVRTLKANSPLLLKEIILEEFDVRGQGSVVQGSGVQSYPAFLPGFFAGIEFPIASTRAENDRLIVAHRPGWTLRPRTVWESRRAVFGIANRGTERQTFERYIAAHRPNPRGLHLNYNSWWTSPAPFYKERDILDLMRAFEVKLKQPYGVCFDTFCIDMGWSDPRSVWQIDRSRFPQGFSAIEAAVHKMGAELGLWISPSAYYHDALDPVWARTNVETSTTGPAGHPFQLCCLGGRRYATAFSDQLVDLVKRYRIRHVKFDGYSLECAETNHGHAPGLWSAESLAEGGIAAFCAVRKVAPDIWLETTCFGFDPSPWWLFHVNSVIGTFGDDAPRGRVPAPVYRESYTSARDYYNLQGAARLPVPVVAQEVLGIIHQTEEPFMNDAVMTVLRGHAFLSLYLNPRYFNDARWKRIAGIMKWARRNAVTLEQTTPILPTHWQKIGAVPEFSNLGTMPRQPYGYSHWNRGKGLMVLRNPWILPQQRALRFDESLGVEPRANGFSLVSLYPESRRYGSDIRYGDVLSIPLAPYETVVLSCEKGLRVRDLPGASEVLAGNIAVRNLEHKATRLEFEDGGPTLGADWTRVGPEGSSALAARLEAEVEVNAAAASFLLLSEGTGSVSAPETATLQIDGKDTALVAMGASATGWAASGYTPPEHWLFQAADVPTGKHRLTLNMSHPASATNGTWSAWIWATRPGKEKSRYPNALPSPETVSLDACCLQEPMEWRSAVEVVRSSRPVERINGVFLDALEPVSVVQGWGRLQKNQSVWEKPMTIAGRKYRRGLGTHADARIRYDIGGSYRRFQSWVGVDGASNGTITFEVWTDGRKRWESGGMKKTSPAQFVDLDVSGVKTLELAVGNGGDNITSDHADWAQAKLLR